MTSEECIKVMCEEEKIMLKQMKYISLNVDLLIDILCKWFEDLAWNTDEYSNGEDGGDSDIDQLMDKGQWNILFDICKRSKMNHFRRVFGYKLTYQFMEWIPKFSIEFLQEWIDTYPLSIELMKEELKRKTRYDIFYDICNCFLEKDSHIKWSKECVEKIQKVKGLGEAFTESVIRDMRNYMEL